MTSFGQIRAARRRHVVLGAAARALLGSMLAIGLALLGLSGSVLADQARISIVDKTFDPTDITVHVGDTVVWTVTKAIADPHSVTSGTLGSADSGKLFDSGATLKDNGATFSFTFNAVATVPFYCVVHPTEMKGIVTVLAASGSGAPPSVPPPSEAPAASGAPASSGPPPSGPAGSGAPTATSEPGPAEALPPVSTTDKAIAAGIIGGALVLLFVSAWLYRRVNG
jgi:plastocyanin